MFYEDFCGSPALMVRGSYANFEGEVLRFYGWHQRSFWANSQFC